MSVGSQVRALRATVASLLSQIEALQDSLQVELICDHPSDERDTSVATFDAPDRWLCKRCGEIGGEKAAEEQ